MTEHLSPKLRKISVRYDRLILDPNNPRFTTRKQDQIPPDDCLEQDNAGLTEAKMDRERYKIAELERSIKQNGWLPVGHQAGTKFFAVNHLHPPNRALPSRRSASD